MNKLLLAGIVSILSLSTTQGCRVEKHCEPYTVRQDSYQPRKWWVCNENGTGEQPVYEPSSEPIPQPV